MTMAKTDTVSPKRHLLQRVYGKVATTFRRSVGELERTRVNAPAAEKEVVKAEEAILGVMQSALAATGQPVVVMRAETDTPEAPAPKGPYWLVQPLANRRNALYARQPLTASIAFIEADGTCSIGAVYFPIEDVCAIAERGLGFMAPDRARCGNRADIAHTLALLPWKTKDVVEMNLLKTLDDATVHTRKTGNTLADVVDVATGRADMAMATHANKLEVLLANLIMAESAGFASDMEGKPLHPASTTVLTANPRLHAKVVALLK